MDVLKREAGYATALNHSNIASIYDIRLDGDEPFIVMEYVPGSLHQLNQSTGPIAVEVAVGIGLQICAALEHAHQHKVLHRDIKPQNILLTADNQVKVTDFGVARAIHEETITKVSGPVGSPLYMAPETMGSNRG